MFDFILIQYALIYREQRMLIKDCTILQFKRVGIFLNKSETSGNLVSNMNNYLEGKLKCPK